MKGDAQIPGQALRKSSKAKGAGGRITASRTVRGTERKQGNFPNPRRLRAIED